MATVGTTHKAAARTAAKHITTAKAPLKAAVKAVAVDPGANKAIAPTVEKSKSKDKRIRDTFAMPKSEFAALDTLKSRAKKAGAVAKKSTLIRAGLRALAAMPDAALARAIQAISSDKP